jgi:hypothetical protein
VVAGRGRHHLPNRRVERGDVVEGTPELERSRSLELLALEQHFAAAQLAEARGVLQRRDGVDAGKLGCRGAHGLERHQGVGGTGHRWHRKRPNRCRRGDSPGICPDGSAGRIVVGRLGAATARRRRVAPPA